MGLMAFDQSRLGVAGADLAYDQAAQNAAGGAYGARSNTFGQQQANKGWGEQTVGMAKGLGDAYKSFTTPPIPGM
jgi:hypothetical protein